MASVDDLELRLADLDDAPQILELFEAAFGEWPSVLLDVTPLEHLEWKMEPPYGIVPRHTVGLLGGVAVATDLRWMSRLYVQGQTVLQNGGADLAVLPAYQGHGFSSAIRDHEIRKSQPGEFSISTANDQRADRFRGSRLLDEPMGLWIRPLSWRARAGVLRGAGIAGAGRALRALVTSSVRSRSRAPQARYDVEELSTFDERFDQLWQATRDEFDLIRVRDATYLNWRYADPRSGRTLIRAASVDGGLAGYLVIRPRSSGPELLDLFAHPDHLGAVAALIGHTATELARTGASALSVALPRGHRYEQQLRRAGLIAVGRGPQLRVVRQPNGVLEFDEAALFGPASRMHVTVGDFEYA